VYSASESPAHWFALDHQGSVSFPKKKTARFSRAQITDKSKINRRVLPAPKVFSSNQTLERDHFKLGLAGCVALHHDNVELGIGCSIKLHNTQQRQPLSPLRNGHELC